MINCKNFFSFVKFSEPKTSSDYHNNNINYSNGVRHTLLFNSKLFYVDQTLKIKLTNRFEVMIKIKSRDVSCSVCP